MIRASLANIFEKSGRSTCYFFYLALSFNIQTLFLLIALYPKLGQDHDENEEFSCTYISARLLNKISTSLL